MKVAIGMCLLPLGLAAPTLFKRELPNNTPVNVKNLDAFSDIKCGSDTVSGSQVNLAVSWGVNLQRAGMALGKSEKYPQDYKVGGKNSAFSFLSPECNKNPRSYLMQFPVTKKSVFGKDGDDASGKWRAIYFYEPGSPRDYEGNPTATYCGTVYDEDGQIQGCDV